MLDGVSEQGFNPSGADMSTQHPCALQGHSWKDLLLTY